MLAVAALILGAASGAPINWSPCNFSEWNTICGCDHKLVVYRTLTSQSVRSNTASSACQTFLRTRQVEDTCTAPDPACNAIAYEVVLDTISTSNGVPSEDDLASVYKSAGGRASHVQPGGTAIDLARPDPIDVPAAGVVEALSLAAQATKQARENRHNSQTAAEEAFRVALRPQLPHGPLGEEVLAIATLDFKAASWKYVSPQPLGSRADGGIAVDVVRRRRDLQDEQSEDVHKDKVHPHMEEEVPRKPDPYADKEAENAKHNADGGVVAQVEKADPYADKNKKHDAENPLGGAEEEKDPYADKGIEDKKDPYADKGVEEKKDPYADKAIVDQKDPYADKQDAYGEKIVPPVDMLGGDKNLKSSDDVSQLPKRARGDRFFFFVSIMLLMAAAYLVLVTAATSPYTVLAACVVDCWIMFTFYWVDVRLPYNIKKYEADGLHYEAYAFACVLVAAFAALRVFAAFSTVFKIQRGRLWERIDLLAAFALLAQLTVLCLHVIVTKNSSRTVVVAFVGTVVNCAIQVWHLMVKLRGGRAQDVTMLPKYRTAMRYRMGRKGPGIPSPYRMPAPRVPAKSESHKQS